MNWECSACDRKVSIITRFDDIGLCNSCYSRHLREDAFLCPCGEWDSPSNWIGGLKGGLCFHCERWERIIAEAGENSVRVGGTHYMVDWKNPIKPSTRSFLGFAGRTFNIRFFDGRVIQTNDLWHQGSVPDRFKERLPDNAEFIYE